MAAKHSRTFTTVEPYESHIVINPSPQIVTFSEHVDQFTKAEEEDIDNLMFNTIAPPPPSESDFEADFEEIDFEDEPTFELLCFS